MKLISFQMIRFFNFAMREDTETTYIRTSVLLSICVFLLTGCAPKVSFQIVRPAAQRVENINYIEIGNFKIVNQSAIAAGVRRVEALRSTHLANYLKKKQQENGKFMTSVLNIVVQIVVDGAGLLYFTNYL